MLMVVLVVPLRFLLPTACCPQAAVVVVLLSIALALVSLLVVVEALRSIVPCCSEQR